MKKSLKFGLIGCALGCGLVVGTIYTSNNVATFNAEELDDVTTETVTETETVVEEVTYPCTVTIENMDYGDVITDLEYGNIGDVCTVYAKPYVLCKTESVSVNGVALTATSKNTYQFTLVEGDNVITASFLVDNEQIQQIYNTAKDVSLGNWENIFTMDNLTNLISWVLSLFMSSGFFVTLLKNKKIQSQTTKEITNAMSDLMNSQMYSAFSDFLKTNFAPVMEQYTEKTDKIESETKTILKCFCLAQEGTAEARLAIINELTNLNDVDESLADQVKKYINEQIAAAEAAKTAKIDALDDLAEANQNITTSNTATTTTTTTNSTATEETESGEGRY